MLTFFSIAEKKKSGTITVRLQWDPHHDLDGTPIPLRRAIQLGLKGVETFTNGEDILKIVDFTSFVSTQNHEKGPLEVLYPLSTELERQLGIGNDTQQKKGNRKRRNQSEDENEAQSENDSQ